MLWTTPWWLHPVSNDDIACYQNLNFSQNESIKHNILINGLVQDCSISIANPLEILQSCTNPSIYKVVLWAYSWKEILLANLGITYFSYWWFSAINTLQPASVRKKHHNENIILMKMLLQTSPEGCQCENLWCSQWWKFYQNNLSILMSWYPC